MHCSGDMYGGVPKTVLPESPEITWLERKFSAGAPDEIIEALAWNDLERPKSVIFAIPSLVMRMFCGFKSRWTKATPKLPSLLRI